MRAAGSGALRSLLDGGEGAQNASHRGVSVYNTARSRQPDHAWLTIHRCQRGNSPATSTPNA